MRYVLDEFVSKLFTIGIVISMSGIFLLISLFATSACLAQSSEGFQVIQTGPGLSLHKEMFMLPGSLSDAYKGVKSEVVFQLSAKHRLFGTRFYFAYTQISFWQAYDRENSSPFRETNYNPELFYRTQQVRFLSGSVGGDIGFEHESNGQRVPLSRSWNLLYVCPYYRRANMLLYLKLRYRVPEDEKEYPGASVGDDNPDITDYIGHNDLHLYYRFPCNHLVHLMIRGNLSTGRGGFVLNYSLPVPHSDQSFICVRVSHGYGESLVDYSRSLSRIGLGIMFSR